MLAVVRWDGGRGGLARRSGRLGWHVTSDGTVQVAGARAGAGVFEALHA